MPNIDSGMDGAVNGAAAGSAFGPWGAVAGAGIGLIGGILGNENSASIAADANRQSWDMLHETQDWQERMRSTQYQTAVADMKLAGLNPMLAYTQGGAGTPSSSPGQVFQRQYRAPTEAMSSAYQAVLGAEKVKADTQVSESAAEVNKAQAANIAADTANKLADNPRITSVSKHQEDVSFRQWQLLSSQIQLTNEQRNRLDKEVQEGGLIDAQRLNYLSQAQRNEVEKTLSALEIQKASNENAFAGTWWGKHVSPVLGDAGKVFNTAGSLAELYRRARMARYIIKGD